MALSTLHWFSPILDKQTTAQVILPESGKPPFATFYLLHGLSDDSSIWLRRTRIEHYVRDLPLIVVMPDGYRSFYTRPPAGPDFAAHIGVELPDCIERHFQARPERSARAVGGLSMGGYGALRVGLAHADRFCSANSHSGAVGWSALNLQNDFATHPSLHGYGADFQRELRAIFGDDPRGTEHDVAWLARRAQASDQLPRLLLDCGTEDFLLEDNRAFHARLLAEEVPHHYREFPGAHDWDYWDLHVREALAFHAENLGLQA
ncbi:MAG: alpha/beta hydrolase family protein [Verrucomicrobia bacterium]|nr:alpha/beta hydrolase family protein [Verrucomicrobiota bacterium]